MDFLYNTGAGELSGGGTPITWLTDAGKMMLTTSSYVPNRDDDVVDAGGANDAVDHEVSGTGYTGGYGGTGRKALASKTITINKANDRVDFDAADIVWTTINVGQVDQAHQVLEDHVPPGTGSSDTETRLISNHDFSVLTNGGDVTMQITDIMRLATA